MIQRSSPPPPDDLQETICETLARHVPAAGRRLRCEIRESRIVLKGCVASYYQKQLAQESVRKLDGVRTIDNEIRVLAPHNRLTAPQTAASR